MKKVLMCTLVSALMAGCGGESNGSDLEKNNPDTASGSDSSDSGAVTPTNQVTVLEGTWKKQCGPVEGEEHHDIVTATFTRGEFTSSIENYTDASCTNPLEMAPNPTASGNFTLGEDVLLSDGITAIELDTHITQFDGAHFDINEYDIAYIANDSLYFGEGEDSPQQRPTSLDYDRPFFRMN